ncbi:hypothetical protein MSAN_00384500 [Mycena sanguinolenta]|uniref:Uncharacterized protein n=1 Tax=Mycena sanguinolenta TaxID=230812 RepID=A0A8H6ZCJ3_9AGAR|nr:hypothetical protein MSAN_00384500 [Mycena sanguinolenta]
MLRCCWRPLVQLGRPYIPHRPYTRSNPPNAKNPLSTGALAKLHAFLAPTNLAAQHPITYTPKTLHKLYLAVKVLPPRKKGHPLNCYELNELLVLFGSLSLPPPRPKKSVYIHSFTSRIRPSDRFRPYWHLVLELAEQIHVRPKRKPRTGVHHFWVMRAHLAQMGARPSAHDNEATASYLRIRASPDPEVHIPYLNAMLARRRSTHLPQIVNFLCKALESYANPDPRLAALLWQIVLGADVVTAPIQERVLAMVWTRLQRRPYISTSPKRLLPQHPLSTRRGLTPADLCAALATAAFPHFQLPLPEVVSKWAAAEAKAIFNPQNAIQARWADLVILALYASPRALSSAGAGSGAGGGGGENERNSHIVWRTVFALAVMERTIPHDAPEPLRTAVRRLWRTWRNAPKPNGLPLVRRVIVGTFFRLAARTRDGPLTDGCARYCAAQGLWGTQLGEMRPEDVVQTTEMLVDYVYAVLHTKRTGWTEIFAALPPEPEWRTKVADALFRNFLPRDVTAAQELYAFCDQRRIAVSGESVHKLAIALADRYFPNEALRFLADTETQFSPDQVEELLDRVVCTLRRERHAFKDVQLADVLGPVMAHLYLDTARTPKAGTKFSLRYALSVLAASGRPTEAAELLRVIHARQPDFFSIHYFLRMMRVLVKHRRTAALSLLQLVQGFPLRARQNFRRKLALRLARSGAHTLAATAYRFGSGPKNQPRTTREALASAVRFRVNRRGAAPSRVRVPRIGPLMTGRPRDAPTVRYGVALLARTGRMRAAKRAVDKAREAGLDGKVLTWLGNTVLNGALHRTKSRHARLVRHVLLNREQLETRLGFVQDRVTVNILVKALLRWRTFMSAAQIRRLFDYMVRSGYPAPGRWLRAGGGVPFGTPVGAGVGTNANAAGALNMLKLSPFISFERHVRPLYRMFIKALQLQGDVVGARTVTGILHDVEDEVLARRHARRRARLAGILHKKAKNP